MDSCLQIMGMIDWERSHPDNIHDISVAYGIDVAWKCFLSVSYDDYILLDFFMFRMNCHNLLA